MDDRFDKGCLYVNVNWKPGKVLGQGYTSDVFEVDQNGGYIMKLSHIPTTDEDEEGIYERSLEIHDRVAKAGLTARIVDRWKCGEYGVIVMKRLDSTVEDYILRTTLTCSERLNLLAALQQAVDKLHSIGIAHGELYSFNMMVGKDPSGYRIPGGDMYLYLIDFDRSVTSSSPEYKENVMKDKEFVYEKITKVAGY